ncbi:hypothetical protein DFP72DRAFT_889188 [Ephemerocybe angulata]|uniref:Uncharacterized protein n=1 Tax=Ephemerocybe angulata TaxID=980116 RepID=A0A8H6M2X0_9AGAR|nr:hypothetical protein DFP72DRAFT_908793 [Tulosesus angulatus]KAF6758415.1 hypothetical protein DFP72DRAFT_889188 [Tulosesus angulatus]
MAANCERHIAMLLLLLASTMPVHGEDREFASASYSADVVGRSHILSHPRWILSRGEYMASNSQARPCLEEGFDDLSFGSSARAT